MAYDNEQHRKEQQQNPLTTNANELDAAKSTEQEQRENDRQFVDRDELNSNTINPPPADPAEGDSLFDTHDDMKTVDHIPLEDLKQEVQDEKHKDHTKDTSSSDKDA